MTSSFHEYALVAAPRLRRTAYLLCRDWALAQDLTQTTLAKMYVHWGRVSSREEPEPYGQKVLTRVFLDSRRLRSPTEFVTADLPETPDPGPDTDLRLTLLDALARLPDRDRAVVVLRYWEDLSVETVADILDLSPSTVKAQSARALTRLRGVLGADALSD